LGDADQQCSAASAIAANTFLRSITAAGFPLFARQMFNNLGIQWAGTLLGCLAGCLVPIPICFYLFGKKLRQKSKFAPTMASKKTDEEESTSESDNESRMPALHASRSRVDQDAEIIRHRSRARTNGSALTGSNTNSQAQEKND
jgi:DHA1 family multidrug resistance protein-like MFS transporter